MSTLTLMSSMELKKEARSLLHTKTVQRTESHQQPVPNPTSMQYCWGVWYLYVFFKFQLISRSHRTLFPRHIVLFPKINSLFLATLQSVSISFELGLILFLLHVSNRTMLSCPPALSCPASTAFPAIHLLTI